MVHFGRYIKSHQVPGWETYYIGYKQLKKRINECAIHAVEGTDEERQEILRRFSKLLDSQVEKIVLFLIEKQGMLAGKLQQLRERAESDLSDDNMDLMITRVIDKDAMIEAYRQIGKDLLNLLQYVEMNTMGLRKILKKFDKRLGLRLREHYLLTRINHPYSQVQQVLRQVGIGAIIATISRNLAELHSEKWRSYSSFTLSSGVSKAVATKEPIVKAIESEYQKLTKEASLLSFIANSLLMQPSDAELSDYSIAEERDYHPWSAYLNQLNTFLYMVNYYVIVPTSDEYAEMLNTPATVSGVIIGSMPLAATVSAILFTLWSNKSYKAPLVVSTLLLIIGNLSYAIALPFNSVWLLVLGRALEGLGCARAINRRYIMHEVPQSKIRNFSAAFVSASALGMTVGPALASALVYVNFSVGGLTVNYCTASGWLLGIAWSLYLVLIFLFFKEPNKSHHVESDKSKDASSQPDEADFGALAPLLDNNLQEEEEEERVAEKKKKSSGGSFTDVLKDFTLPIQILLVNYFMLKFASEMLVSEATLVTGYYFSWTSSTVGWFLGALGITVLPSSAVVANYISNRFQDRLIIIWTILFTTIGVLGNLSYTPFFSYTQAQYIISSLLLFISTNILEGVDMSLLAKMMSPRLSKGLFNCGFLSTEAGTIARAVADGLITLVGRGGMGQFLNLTMLPTLVIVLGTLVYTWFGYYSLY